MSTPSQDYGEPWTLMDTGATHDRNDDLVADKLAKMRFIACVNACAGMTDPAAEIQAMREAIKLASIALEMADDEIYPPIPNCSCHISPPCNDCVDNSQVRETSEFIKRALTKLQPFAKP